MQAFGSAREYGALPDATSQAVVGIVRTRSANGYWLATASGRVFAFGDAGFFGDASDVSLNSPVVAIATTPTGHGYWLVAADGGLFSFGDAAFFGSTAEVRLNSPVVARAATPTGRGYWFTASDGGVFSFGDATFLGSTGDIRLNKPIAGMAATASGRGYWFVASDGGVFGFGDARYFGSTTDLRLNDPIVGMGPTRSGDGYWLIGADGGVFTFGNATYFGSMAASMPDGGATVGIAPNATDDGYWIAAGPGAVKIAVAGDVHGEKRVRNLLDSGRNPLELVAAELRRADVAIVNLETPVGNGGQPQSKQYVFLAPPSLATALAAGGVNVVTLANNHALDHGRGALMETIDHARAAGLHVVGAGATSSEAFRPAFVPVRGRTVAVVGLSRVVPPGWGATANTPGVASAYAEASAVAAVRDAARRADYVVVVVHWGTELARCPDGQLLRLVRVLRDAGADVIAGHHPHVLQGARWEGPAVAAYSLGNFVWYHSDPPSDTTALLEVNLSRGSVQDWKLRPARIDGAGRPYLLTGADADRLSADIASLAPGAGRCPR